MILLFIVLRLPVTANGSGRKAETPFPLVVLALVLIGVAVFWPVRDCEFLEWDDHVYITQNPQVLQGLSWEGLGWAFHTTRASNWHPLTWLSHMVDVELFALRPAGHHLMNLALHVVNSVFLLIVLWRMTGALWRSALVAVLFSVHPLHVESVAWVSERKDLLSTAFWLLSLAAYLRYSRRPGAGRYIPVVILFALALLAKATPVTLPFLLLLLDFWPLNRWRQGAERARLLAEKIPLFVLAAASSTVTFLVQQQAGAMKSIAAIPLGGKLSNAIVSYAAYLAKMFWPAGLAAFYPHPGGTLPLWKVTGSAVLLLLICVFAVRVRRRYPFLLSGWLWYLGTLVPMIGVVQVGNQALADRYTYIPLIGLFLALAWGAAAVPAFGRRRGLVSAAMATALVAALMITARVQVGHWRNTILLFEHAARVTHDNRMALGNIALQHSRQGRYREAVDLCLESLRLNPRDAGLCNDIGVFYERMGKPEEAENYYRQALALEPDHAGALTSLGMLLFDQGKVREAVGLLEQALLADPRSAEVRYNLGNIFFKLGSFEKAAGQYRAALGIRPDFFEAQKNLGIALSRSARPQPVQEN